MFKERKPSKKAKKHRMSAYGSCLFLIGSKAPRERLLLVKVDISILLATGHL